MTRKYGFCKECGASLNKYGCNERNCIMYADEQEIDSHNSRIAPHRRIPAKYKEIL